MGVLPRDCDSLVAAPPGGAILARQSDAPRRRGLCESKRSDRHMRTGDSFQRQSLLEFARKTYPWLARGVCPQ